MSNDVCEVTITHRTAETNRGETVPLDEFTYAC
jgi:hypothetical protein